MGGCCDCSCVADASHVCICSCLTPFPKTATTGDGLGSHVLTWNGSSAWTVTGTATVETWQAQAGTFICINPLTISVPVVYTLTFNCPGVSFPNGRWTLNVNFSVLQCRANTISDPATQHYGDPARGGSFLSSGNNPQNSIDLTCDPADILSFSIPTTTTNGLPTLGGGGAMSVVFG